MRNTLVVVVAALAACGQPEPKAPHGRRDTAPAVGAMQQGKFEVALRESGAVLSGDSHNAQAAAVHAVSRYQQAGSKVFTDLSAVLEKADSLKFFDHEGGRAAWRTFLAELEAVDRDLAVAAADPDFALEVCLACWEVRDWNHNGRIDDQDRHLFELEFDGKGSVLSPTDPRRKPTYRFDHGDVLWARAMVSFQRAIVELVLAYRWSELDKLFLGDERLHITIKLIDPGRVKHARELVLAGLAFADQTREAYLAETDDDREWVPNPRQKSYAMPLDVDDKLYAMWGAVTGDLRNMLESKDGISLRDVATALIGRRAAGDVPNVYVDLGRMLREPSDIVIDLNDDLPPPKMLEHLFRGVLGHGYAESMRATPLVGRLSHMKEELDRGEDTINRKLRYLMWLN